MRVTTLIDNSPGPNGLVSGHGLSLGISNLDNEVLFDTGPSNAVVGNARILGYDLDDVDLVILSHGHYDHGGGLEAFFSVNSKAPLYLKEGADDEFFAERGQECRYIGLDREMLGKNEGRLRWVRDSMEISSNIHLIASFPKTYDRPAGNLALKVKRGDRLLQDPFDHEIALVVREDDGIAIFSGCGHSGVLNMVSAARSGFPNERIKAVVGGFHQITDPRHSAMSGTSEMVREMGRELVRLGCAQIYGGHCTGAEASKILQDELGNVYHELHTGLIFDI
ncbi:MAG: MBL fold metallo-hydrolase [Methanomassiliicoccales archaeon]|jgi:7,8-dihydropterin-6-yl-methyl-4-(beta-D-ribofuranosyl)aminobenzene 5'-phosphate synthase